MKTVRWINTALLILLMLVIGCGSTTETSQQDAATAKAARNLGEAYMQEGRLTAALREFKKAEAINPDDAFLQYDLGLVFLYRDRYDEAIDYFKRALELKPDYPAALNSMGNAYLRKKDYDKAISYYRQTTEDMLYATPQYPYSNMALAYFAKGEYGLAEKYFLEALKIDPRFDRAMAGLAETYMAMGRYPEAISKLQSAVHVSPNAPSLHYLLAQAYLKFGDYQSAYLEFQKVVELAPNTPDAERANQEIQKIKPLL
jgi:type IV pilus biogenesis/stability protein PilW